MTYNIITGYQLSYVTQNSMVPSDTCIILSCHEIIMLYTQFFYKHVNEFLGYKWLNFLPFLVYKLLNFFFIFSLQMLNFYKIHTKFQHKL